MNRLIAATGNETLANSICDQLTGRFGREFEVNKEGTRFKVSITTTNLPAADYEDMKRFAAEIKQADRADEDSVTDEPEVKVNGATTGRTSGSEPSDGGVSNIGG